MRICPQCKGKTDLQQCPHDGFTTVSEQLYATPSGPDPLVGQVFERRYKVEALIGRGGFGSVYKAVQLSVGGRPVALKVLRRDLASSLEQVARFQREAHASSFLSHPNTIRVFDFGQTDGGDLFMVTELLQGEPLSRCLRREGRLPADRAVRIAAQVLKSLAEAHERGIVHRDVKPDNVFLQTVRGEHDLVKVLDFGVAKLAALEDGSALTQTGAVLGSPAYMAPEQALGKPVDARADLYAVGVMLYEMLSGRLPFVSDQIMQILTAHVVSPVPRLADQVAVPPALAALVHQCLEKDPTHRPQSADELREALERALVEAPLAPAPVRPVDVGALDTLAPPGPGRDTVVTPAPPVVDLTGSLIGEGPHVTSAETPPSTSFSMRAVRSRTRKGIYAGLGVTAAVVVALLAWPRPDGGPVESGVSSEPPVSSAPPAEAEVAEVRVAGAAAVPVAGAADVQPAPAQAAAPPVVEPSVVHVFRYPVSYRSADIAPGQGKGRRGIETELPEPERRRPPRRTPPVVAPTPAGTGLEVEWQ